MTLCGASPPEWVSPYLGPAAGARAGGGDTRPAIYFPNALLLFKINTHNMTAKTMYVRRHARPVSPQPVGSSFLSSFLLFQEKCLMCCPPRGRYLQQHHQRPQRDLRGAWQSLTHSQGGGGGGWFNRASQHSRPHTLHQPPLFHWNVILATEIAFSRVLRGRPFEC